MLRKGLYGNVVLFGGTTMFVGIGDRVTEDVVGRGVAPQRFHRSVFVCQGTAGSPLLGVLNPFDRVRKGHADFEFSPWWVS